MRPAGPSRRVPRWRRGGYRARRRDGQAAALPCRGWTIGPQSITAGTGAGITLAFHAADVYLDVGGTGTLTVCSGEKNTVIKVSGAPDIYTVATEQPAGNGTVSIRLSPGLQAYSFTFG